MINSTFCVFYHNNKEDSSTGTSSSHVKNMLTVNLCISQTMVHLLLEFDAYSWDRDSSDFITKAFNAKSEYNEISLWQAHNNCPSYNWRGIIVFSSLTMKLLTYFKSWSEKTGKQSLRGILFSVDNNLTRLKATWRGMKLRGNIKQYKLSIIYL